MSSANPMSNTVRTIVLRLATLAWALWLILPTCSIAQNAEITCADDNCKNLWLDDLPTTLSGVKLGEKQVSDLPDFEICRLLAFPISGRGEESIDEWCNNISIDRNLERAKTGTQMIRLKYDHEKILKTDGYDIRFYVSNIFADKLRAYIPCYLTHSMTFSRGGGIPIMRYNREYYFELFPQRELLFQCSYELSGTAAAPITEYMQFPYQAAPFGIVPEEKFHRAAVLADISSVKDGQKILQIMIRHADNAKERTRICRHVGNVCWAPRRIRLPKHQLASEAIAFCEHQMIDGALFLPRRCAYFAIRLKHTNDYLIEALVSPDTFYPSGNGLGDADIVCKKNDTGNMDSIIKRKYPVEKGYRIAKGTLTRVVRKGQISEVYSDYRENLIILLSNLSGADEIIMTPTIYFSPQNVRSQDQYRPISDIEYEYYSAKIIERMKPELECIDGRK